MYFTLAIKTIKILRLGFNNVRVVLIELEPRNVSRLDFLCGRFKEEMVLIAIKFCGASGETVTFYTCFSVFNKQFQNTISAIFSSKENDQSRNGVPWEKEAVDFRRWSKSLRYWML